MAALFAAEARAKSQPQTQGPGNTLGLLDMATQRTQQQTQQQTQRRGSYDVSPAVSAPRPAGSSQQQRSSSSSSSIQTAGSKKKIKKRKKNRKVL